MVFAERARRHKRNLSVLAYLGIATPAALGAVVASYGLDAAILPHAIKAAAGIGIVQLMVSVLAVTTDWSENLEYSNESATENLYLSKKFEQLGQMAKSSPRDLKARYERLVTIDESRSKQDTKRNVSEKELRKAHRYGLRQFQRECVGCKLVPTSMKTTKCDICGRF